MAMMGISAASGRSSARMARTVSRPFITGIMMSMSITSKAPFGASAKASSASLPFQARVTEAPRSSSRNSAISMFSSLSSASRTWMPSSQEEPFVSSSSGSGA